MPSKMIEKKKIDCKSDLNIFSEEHERKIDECRERIKRQQDMIRFGFLTLTFQFHFSIFTFHFNFSNFTRYDPVWLFTFSLEESSLFTQIDFHFTFTFQEATRYFSHLININQNLNFCFLYKYK